MRFRRQPRVVVDPFELLSGHQLDYLKTYNTVPPTIGATETRESVMARMRALTMDLTTGEHPIVEVEVLHAEVNYLGNAAQALELTEE